MNTLVIEYFNLQKYYGEKWINHLLGNLTSYKALRELHSYQDIYNSIEELEEESK